MKNMTVGVGVVGVLNENGCTMREGRGGWGEMCEKYDMAMEKDAELNESGGERGRRWVGRDV